DDDNESTTPPARRYSIHTRADGAFQVVLASGKARGMVFGAVWLADIVRVQRTILERHASDSTSMDTDEKEEEDEDEEAKDDVHDDDTRMMDVDSKDE